MDSSFQQSLVFSLNSSSSSGGALRNGSWIHEFVKQTNNCNHQAGQQQPPSSSVHRKKMSLRSFPTRGLLKRPKKFNQAYSSTRHTFQRYIENHKNCLRSQDIRMSLENAIFSKAKHSPLQQNLTKHRVRNGGKNLKTTIEPNPNKKTLRQQIIPQQIEKNNENTLEPPRKDSRITWTCLPEA